MEMNEIVVIVFIVYGVLMLLLYGKKLYYTVLRMKRRRNLAERQRHRQELALRSRSSQATDLATILTPEADAVFTHTTEAEVTPGAEVVRGPAAVTTLEAATVSTPEAATVSTSEVAATPKSSLTPEAAALPTRGLHLDLPSSAPLASPEDSPVKAPCPLCGRSPATSRSQSFSVTNLQQIEEVAKRARELLRRIETECQGHEGVAPAIKINDQFLTDS